MFAMRVSFIFLLLFASLFSDEEIARASPPVAELPVAAAEAPPSEGKTINYNTVSIIEYIRFASKICKTNFIYEEGDLNFTITVVSDEPATQQNVMATLLQVLRVHGLELLEQDNNLVIHNTTQCQTTRNARDRDVKRRGHPSHRHADFPRQKYNARRHCSRRPADDLHVSATETVPDTKQLILTDVTANVEKSHPDRKSRFASYAARDQKF